MTRLAVVVGQPANVRCGAKATSTSTSPSRRSGPPVRDAETDAKRQALVARMKAAAKTATAQGGLTE